jgi:hypothetical protein
MYPRPGSPNVNRAFSIPANQANTVDP